MNLDHLLKQTCTISAQGAQDGHGKRSYGTGVEVACRFQKTSTTLTTSTDDRTPIDGLVWVAAGTTVNRDDKLVFAGDTYRVMRAEPMVDGAGVTRHTEIMVQEWSL